VLANDTDADSTDKATWVVALVSPPSHGTLTLRADGTFTYAPAPGYVGTDTFSYQVNNGIWTRGGSSVPLSANSNTATVTVTVNPVPVPPTPITFYRTDVWLSTSSANRTFDLKAEVLKNGVPVLAKTVSGQKLGEGTTFNKALYKAIGDFPSTSVGFAAGDTLSVRVSLRLSATPGRQQRERRHEALKPRAHTATENSSHLHAQRGDTVRCAIAFRFRRTVR
jgi:hypothetical protein